MSAAGRLWRRAPAWRFCLLSAIAFTGLAALFPGGLRNLKGTLTEVAQRSVSTAPQVAPAPGRSGPAHFVPQSDPEPGHREPSALTPEASSRSQLVPFSGRQLPLPTGEWHTLILATAEGLVPVSTEVFARIEAGRVSGLLTAIGTNPVNGGTNPILSDGGCSGPDDIADEVVRQPPDASPAVHECWSVVTVDLTSQQARTHMSEVLARAVDRLQAQQITLSAHFLGLLYMRASQDGWLRLLLLLPQQEGKAGAARQVAWMRRFTGELHRGFDGGLKPHEPGPAILRDPT